MTSRAAASSPNASSSSPRAPWRAALQPEQPAEQDQVLAAGQVLVDRRELAGEADQAADLVGLVDDVVPEHARRARVGADQRGEHADRGRLPGAVRAEHAVHRAGAHRQVHAVDGASLAEGLHEAVGFNGQWGWGLTSGSWGVAVSSGGETADLDETHRGRTYTRYASGHESTSTVKPPGASK